MTTNIQVLQQIMSPQEAYMRNKIHQQAKKIDGVFVTEFFSQIYDGEMLHSEEFLGGGREERTFRSMLTQFIAQESTKQGRGIFSEDIEKSLLNIQFGSQFGG